MIEQIYFDYFVVLYSYFMCFREQSKCFPKEERVVLWTVALGQGQTVQYTITDLATISQMTKVDF